MSDTTAAAPGRRPVRSPAASSPAPPVAAAPPGPPTAGAASSPTPPAATGGATTPAAPPGGSAAAGNGAVSLVGIAAGTAVHVAPAAGGGTNPGAAPGAPSGAPGPGASGATTPAAPSTPSPTTPTPVAVAGRGTNPGAAPATPPASSAAGAAGDPLKDALREVLLRLERGDAAAGAVPGGLRRELRDIAEASGGRLSEPALRHRLAYAIQDIERTPVGGLALPSAARAEVEHLAAGAPGLTNNQLPELLRAAATMPGQRLLNDARDLAWKVGKLADQGTPDVASQIDALTNRIQLAARVPGPGAPTSAPAPAAPPAHPAAAAARAPAFAQSPIAVPGGGAPAAGVGAPGGNAMPVLFRESGLGALLRGGVGAPGVPGGTTPPWEAAATPMKERIGAMNERMVLGAEHQRIEGAERAGKAALSAVAAFGRTTAGAAVMGKIEAAARTDPGGLKGVLSGMREGDRYQDLRLAFNGALALDGAAAAAHQKAADALGRYGMQRAAVEPLVARQPDAARIADRLQRLDAEIGKAAAATPDREDGQTLASRFGEVAAEIVRRAAEVVKSAFGRRHTTEAGTAAPRPSPSLGL